MKSKDYQSRKWISCWTKNIVRNKILSVFHIIKVSYMYIGFQKSIKLTNTVWIAFTWHLGSRLIAACIHTAAVEGLLPWWCLSCNLDKSLQSVYLSGKQWRHFSRNDFASSQFSSRRPYWRTVKYIPELSISVPTSSWRTAWVKVTSRDFKPRAQRASRPWREAGCSCELFNKQILAGLKIIQQPFNLNFD